jgi:hypothetical protein
LVIDTAADASRWVASSGNITISNNGISRDVNYFEDEDENDTSKMIKLTVGPDTNTYIERPIASTNLSAYDYLTVWCYATSAGDIIRLGFGENSATEQEQTLQIDTVNTWQKLYWDISNIPQSQRDEIKYLRLTIPGGNNVIYFQNLTADRYLTDPDGSPIYSTANEYIQYRAILSTTNPAYVPKLYNVQLDWNSGYKIVQTDANSVRLYNFTGTTQELKLDAIVFGADLAEYYTVEDKNIGPGDVVAFTGKMDDYGVPILRKTNQVNDPQIAGAISTKAGQALGIEAEDRRLLALAGRIPIKIGTDSAIIKVGDLLTSSQYPAIP